MDSTGENWQIQVPEHTAKLLMEKGYPCKLRGEIDVKGKGIMLTYFVLDKNQSISQLASPSDMPGASTPSLQRQTSHHSSLAAVVYGMIQATKRSTITTRESNNPLCMQVSRSLNNRHGVNYSNFSIRQ